jgi:uncharacterized Zn finger protein (UPF0148 family)
MKQTKCMYCGFPLKLSKKGNLYCSNICWEKEPYKTDRELDRLETEAYMDSQHGDWGCR